ncbi:hypothetical protein BKA70DRAFT_1565701 [Coprinopsis sp. MPI-PUGE-AT-0042]|nr:hypothetical protein BKA70DRAFT_1565701 [Coprinopsis sp. MPI-PUGE-AT-0042]
MAVRSRSAQRDTEFYSYPDLSSANPLFKLSTVSNVSSDDHILSLLGEPETEEILAFDNPSPGPEPHAPQLAVPSINAECFLALLTQDITLTDFGQSFAFNERPEGHSAGTVIHYTPPGTSPWIARGGLLPLRRMDAGMCLALGELPDPWWSAYEARHKFFDDAPGEPKSEEEQEAAGLLFKSRKSSIREQVDQIGSQAESPVGSYSVLLCEPKSEGLDEAEKERITMKEVVAHPWFTYGET